MSPNIQGTKAAHVSNFFLCYIAPQPLGNGRLRTARAMCDPWGPLQHLKLGGRHSLSHRENCGHGRVQVNTCCFLPLAPHSVAPNEGIVTETKRQNRVYDGPVFWPKDQDEESRGAWKYRGDDEGEAQESYLETFSQEPWVPTNCTCMNLTLHGLLENMKMQQQGRSCPSFKLDGAHAGSIQKAQ